MTPDLAFDHAMQECSVETNGCQQVDIERLLPVVVGRAPYIRRSEHPTLRRCSLGCRVLPTPAEMRLITSGTPAAVPISVCTKRGTACPSGKRERAVVATEAPLRVKTAHHSLSHALVPPLVTRNPLALKFIS